MTGKGGMTLNKKRGNSDLDVKQKFFAERAVKPGHRLPRAVCAPSMEVLEARLDGLWAAWFGGWQHSRRVVTGWALMPLPT